MEIWKEERKKVQKWGPMLCCTTDTESKTMNMNAVPNSQYLKEISWNDV